MRHASLLAAVGVVLIANAAGLAHAWRNRSGAAESEITLTERELELSNHADDKDTGVELHLRWTDPAFQLSGSPSGSLPNQGDSGAWLGPSVLQGLGFDTSVAASDGTASEFYRRQRARRVFVALEYGGEAWRRYRDRTEGTNRPGANGESDDSTSRLIAVDADTDASRLRARRPDRSRVIIIPAVVRIGVRYAGLARIGLPAGPGSLYGWIEDVPSSIHVPRPFSDEFRRLPKDRRDLSYWVRVRYGSSLEPWIVGVDLSGRSGR